MSKELDKEVMEQVSMQEPEKVVAVKDPKKEIFEIQTLFPTAGKLEVTPMQEDALFEPVDESSVEIRPDGLIYLPWNEYQGRLTKAFGMSWCMIPKGEPQVKGNSVFWGHYLVIQGHYCGYAIGEQAYYPGNQTMTWSDAVEGAWSNCLMRLCKHLGITTELWSPSFIKAWKDKYAEQYVCQEGKNKGKTLWRKKGAVSNGAVDIEPEPQPEVEQPPPQESEESIARSIAIIKDKVNELTEWQQSIFYDEFGNADLHKLSLDERRLVYRRIEAIAKGKE